MAGLNTNRIQSSSDKKAQLKLTSRCVFPLPLLFCRLSTVFFIDSETNESIPLHILRCFFFLKRKTFPVECLLSGAASCKMQAPRKGGNFGAKLIQFCGF